MKLVVHWDGGCRQKSGVAGGAAILFDHQGNELAHRAKLLRGVTTPVAEYTALHLGLVLAAEYAGLHVAQTHVLALGDAELVVRQVDGRYNCRKLHLRALLEMTHLLMQPFGSCEVREFPKAGPENKRRFGNDKADALVNECMDQERDL